MPDVAEPDDAVKTGGRAAQRRRTRKAIVDAAAGLLAAGRDPSLAEVATAADVSRRTVYMYFSSVDQLLLDASQAAVEVDVDAALARAGDDVRARVVALVAVIADGLATSLPVGRKLIKLTVDTPPAEGAGPRRGYRRVGWIESALAPARGRLDEAEFEQLVSALALLVGWEPYIVLFDVRGLAHGQAVEVVTRSALTLLDAALAGTPHPGGEPSR